MFIYGMKLRGFRIGAQPDGVIEWNDTDKEKTGFYSIIKYEKKLTKEKVKKYDLVELGDDIKW